MTLVLSDLSRHGVIMLGDSAVVRRVGGTDIGTAELANKVQFFEKAKIGVAIWGVRSIGDKKTDKILERFIVENDDDSLGLEDCGNMLANHYNKLLDEAGLVGKNRTGGIHLAGYAYDYPKLWHVHWSATGTEGPWGLAKDFPESKGITENEFQRDLSSGRYAQLANGFHRILNMAREGIRRYSELLFSEKGLQFPENSVEGQMTFVRTLFLMVPAALRIPAGPCYVNENLRMIVFDKRGLIKPPLTISVLEESIK